MHIVNVIDEDKAGEKYIWNPIERGLGVSVIRNESNDQQYITSLNIYHSFELLKSAHGSFVSGEVERTKWVFVFRDY